MLQRYLQRSQLQSPEALAGALQWEGSWSTAGKHKGNERGRSSCLQEVQLASPQPNELGCHICSPASSMVSACSGKKVCAHILQPSAAACGRGRQSLIQAIQVGARCLCLLKRLSWRGSPQPCAQKGLHLLYRHCLALAAISQLIGCRK